MRTRTDREKARKYIRICPFDNSQVSILRTSSNGQYLRQEPFEQLTKSLTENLQEDPFTVWLILESPEGFRRYNSIYWDQIEVLMCVEITSSVTFSRLYVLFKLYWFTEAILSKPAENPLHRRKDWVMRLHTGSTIHSPEWSTIQLGIPI